MTTVNTNIITDGKPSTPVATPKTVAFPPHFVAIQPQPVVNPASTPVSPCETYDNLHTPTIHTLDPVLYSLQALYISRQSRFYSNLRQWSSQQITDYTADQLVLEQAIDNLDQYLKTINPPAN